MAVLQYYFEDGTHVIFDKYTIDIYGVIKNNKTGMILSIGKKGSYNKCSVYDNNGKQCSILIGHAMASTFHGKPPTMRHTADHKDRNRSNDILNNIRWYDTSEQRINQERPDTHNNALIIIKDGKEMTAKEWNNLLKGDKNYMGRHYTPKMIMRYARNKQYGYSFKEYPDLPGEIWKEIANSKNTQGYWKISDMNRIKYITKYAENILSGDRLGLIDGYPRININKKDFMCHILAFMTFFPEDYANKKPSEMILHEDDDKMDFRPHKLRIGTRTENSYDAYNNGKHDSAKTARMRCSSYINDELEKEHESQRDAVRYLKSKGVIKASTGGIRASLVAFSKGEIVTRYGRTWKNI